ncbi:MULTISPECIES: phosphatase PAP2 family protein [unclassified Cryobacterium]|uniref:phosphatase PAP2 family protein n=1 Tax=unclassified Cryobacterium TaxID=2649013 RepID=UPI002AB4BDCC|nr:MULTISPECIES: phosphatase PAP2 family protein [unclassified Cryobacterium]MDY7543911.1 phosphatase PAP2 family protein [Cryobacterium sp. 5B3]MEA9997642.1 phosphatase PAP2 family protein [Cryobacterium sp. RTS3]MEB0264498.1 phosphatase PAP2 family protein [Cryobacterium sp. 10I5]MEB0273623.1 phosphatase PAP2 family protein [Cryobacterium sp. 5B3]
MTSPHTDDERPTVRGIRSRFIAEERVLGPDSRRRLYLTSMILAGSGAACFLAILASVLLNAGLTGVDAPVQDWLFGLRSPIMTAVMIGLAILFGPVALPGLLLVVCVVWGIVGKHARRPLILASAMLVGVVLAQLIGHAVDRHRPPTDLMLFGPDPSFSFPSGHVLGASDFVLLTAYLVFSRRGSIRGAVAGFGFALLCIVAAAVSRVYLGYHWATDALASVSLSLMIVGGVIAYDTWRSLRASEESQITIPPAAD